MFPHPLLNHNVRIKITILETHSCLFHIIPLQLSKVAVDCANVDLLHPQGQSALAGKAYPCYKYAGSVT
jgi:hypothetical protein